MKTKRKTYQNQNARKTKERIKFEKIIADNIKYIRLRNNFTQLYVCQNAGISTPYYSEVENNHKGIGLFHLYKLSQFYMLPMNWFCVKQQGFVT